MAKCNFLKLLRLFHCAQKVVLLIPLLPMSRLLVLIFLFQFSIGRPSDKACLKDIEIQKVSSLYKDIEAELWPCLHSIKLKNIVKQKDNRVKVIESSGYSAGAYAGHGARSGETLHQSREQPVNHRLRPFVGDLSPNGKRIFVGLETSVGCRQAFSGWVVNFSVKVDTHEEL